ncbi:protein tyrosine phosphatase family protein [Magnetofaba australis]|nr:protein tyrosine phosphatase family protein [Magnetofaba australis]
MLGSTEMTTSISSLPGYLLLAADLHTSGQPMGADLHAAAQAGVAAVINLALPESIPHLPGEAQIVAELGMDYHPIPVPFDAPEAAHLQRFYRVMQSCKRPVLVHCALNKRVSVFTALYRYQVMGLPWPEACAHIAQIWRPDPIWEEFIEESIGLAYPP